MKDVYTMKDTSLALHTRLVFHVFIVYKYEVRKHAVST